MDIQGFSGGTGDEYSSWEMVRGREQTECNYWLKRLKKGSCLALVKMKKTWRPGPVFGEKGTVRNGNPIESNKHFTQTTTQRHLDGAFIL